jgi:hypothetical protein
MLNSNRLDGFVGSSQILSGLTTKYRLSLQAIWRSLGGITTKILCGCRRFLQPLHDELTAGNTHDCVTGYDILESMDLSGTQVIADRGYDMNNIVDMLEQQAVAVIQKLSPTGYSI